MASDGAVKTKRKAASQPMAGTINAQRFAESRAAELESLHSIISTRLNNDFRSRRRTTSFTPRQKKVKVRRRMELKKNDELGFGVSGDGTKRLRTHVWLAKRFTMHKLWGFHLPLALHGSGRGSRALLKWCKQGALVHDATFYSVVQLKASQASISLFILSLSIRRTNFVVRF